MFKSAVDLVANSTEPPKRPALLPGKKVSPEDRAWLLYLASYLRMRLVIGAFGLGLPPLLWAVESVLSREVNPSSDLAGSLRGSMSSYYHSPSRDIFVASLCVMGLFLMVYRVSPRRFENVVTTVAGALAVTVELCPSSIPHEPVNSVCPAGALPAGQYPECPPLSI